MSEDPSQAKRVLFVDDDDAVRRAIGRTLANDGYEVVEASDGRAAVNLLESERFDLVLSDIAMPEMDGMALLRTVRARDPDVPVVLMSGTPNVHTAIEAIEYGVYRYLVKPVEVAVLLRVVKKAVILGRVARLKRDAIDLSGEGLGAADLAGLEASFGRAMDSLWMAYQPIVRVSDRSLFGYETLLRSQEQSLPHPGAMLDAAERLDRLFDLGRRIRDRGAGPMAAAPDATLFINLHPRDLADDALLSPDAPLSKIARRVILEVTERASLENLKDLPDRIATLRSLGFRLAVDDLGAGYAGLTSFAQLEPEIVKLDMTLVRDVHLSHVKQKLVRSMSSLCHDLGSLIVAEGVENASERDALVELGCDLLQGYYLAKPGKAFPTFSWGGA